MYLRIIIDRILHFMTSFLHKPKEIFLLSIQKQGYTGMEIFSITVRIRTIFYSFYYRCRRTILIQKWNRIFFNMI